MDHNMTGMMDMVINFREREVILFSFWKTGTVSGMAVSMLISFLICILYEAIKGFRLFLAIYHVKQRHANAAMTSSQFPLADSGGDNVSQDTIPFAPILQITGLTKRVFSGFRLAQAALYGVQALLAICNVMKRVKPDPDRIDVLTEGEKIALVGERYVSTPSMSQSSHFSDPPLEDITDYDENVVPESAETQHVSVLGSRPRPKRRSSGKSAVEQLASFVKATEKPELDCYEISCMNMNMASTLKNIANYDDALAQEFKMKLDRLQLEATQEVIRFKRGSQD